MSKKSNRRHRQQKDRKHVPSLGHTAVPAQNSQGGTKRRALWIGVAVVVVVAVVYAVGGSGERKGEIAAGSAANWITSAPAPSLLSAKAGGTSAAGVSGPKIAFATPVHDFGQIKGGEAIKYTYVFTNIGSATLAISNVQTSCGCTTAGEWTRQVEPGMSGSIPIEFNSGNFNGEVTKSITVTCNDPTQPTVALQLKATIWRPIDIIPQVAVLNVTSESPSNATTVRILNNVEEPLTLSVPESSNPAFAADLKIKQPGKEFELVVKTVPPLPAGNVQGQITLKTSSTNLPVISVSVFANVLQTVMVQPSQITLPTAPLANATPVNVLIRNNGTNVLSLMEPAVNAQGVDVQLKEIEAGRFFTLTVSFPAGFEMAQGEKVELSVKSNHPQFPIIKVPVLQPLRPAPSAASGQVVPPTPPQAAAQ